MTVYETPHGPISIDWFPSGRRGRACFAGLSHYLIVDGRDRRILANSVAEVLATRDSDTVYSIRKWGEVGIGFPA